MIVNMFVSPALKQERDPLEVPLSHMHDRGCMIILDPDCLTPNGAQAANRRKASLRAQPDQTTKTLRAQRKAFWTRIDVVSDRIR
jgi:hypothetical protein